MGLPLDARKEKLKDFLDKPGEKIADRYIKINKDQDISVPVYNIPINLPIYRLKNIRTLSPQSSYIAKNAGVNDDFFSKDSENRDALAVQHGLLLNIATEGTINHYEIFQKKQFDKNEALILTKEGVLLNGNTRVSAMRQLYKENPQKYAHLRVLPMAILPESTGQPEENFIELALQIHPDIKKEYKWTSVALSVKSRLEKEEIKDIATEFELKKSNVGHPENLLCQLAIVDKYLEFIGEPKKLKVFINNSKLAE